MAPPPGLATSLVVRSLSLWSIPNRPIQNQGLRLEDTPSLAILQKGLTIIWILTRHP